jgi:ABC-type dipeptide/oligopeptide/nickel transport system permease component
MNWPFKSSVAHIILLAITLACPAIVIIARMMQLYRNLLHGFLSVSGLRNSERRVVLKHAMRNSLLPTITAID